MSSPLRLVPWHQDFLSALLDRALEDTQGRLDRAVFIFPHGRPMRYLTLLMRKRRDIAKPLVMPRMLTVAGLFSALASRALGKAARQAGQLDRVALLLRCVREDAGAGPGFGPAFALDAPSFFPWGLKLDALFEECFVHCRTPDNFLYVDDAVSPYAAMLLSRLGSLFSRYTLALRDRGWTSPGFDARLAGDVLESGAPLPADMLAPFSAQKIYIAGFHLLNGAEDALFKRLWREHGAEALIHADPFLAVTGERAHWSCDAFADWAARWRTGIALLPGCDGLGGKEPRPRFVAGHDLHSQLAVLKEELNVAPAPAPDDAPDDASGRAAHRADTAIILPAGDLLLPTLHHLPDKNVNISMGYPLARSPLFRLLDTLGALQENRKGKAYYWRGLIDLFRHPYIKMLSPVEDGLEADHAEPAPTPLANTPRHAGALAVRRILHRLEKTLRLQGLAYCDPRALLTAVAALDDGPAGHTQATGFVEQLFSVCLEAFENADTTQALALALERFCSMLIRHGQDVWPRFPIDAECLYRLRQSVIPELAAADFGDELFPPARLFAMLRSLLEAQRVPFEAEPLVGVQVLGMLESRLLSFRRVIVVDATEERLPGSPSGDPLLPEALRPELGLPASASGEQAAAYTFFRLLHGADDCLLLWSDSADAPGIQEMKSGKSRFVQELLWREEKSRGRLFARQGKDGPLEALGASISPMLTREKAVRVAGPVRDLLNDLSKRPLSASLLDSYLTCPVRFFYERLLALKPAEEVNEGDDPAAVGDLLHHCLETVYAPLINRPLPGGGELLALLGNDMRSTLFGSPAFTALERTLPADSLSMLREAGKKRLDDYLLNQPPATVLATESPLKARFQSGGLTFRLAGKADRIDCRVLPRAPETQGLVVVDYKSGRVPDMHASVWNDAAFWRDMAALEPRTRPDGPDALDAAAARLASVQLPLYALICSLAPEDNGLPALPVANALWVELGGGGGEKCLLSPKTAVEQGAIIMDEHIPSLIHGILLHLFHSEYFSPRPGPHCGWCSCKKSCMVLA